MPVIESPRSDVWPLPARGPESFGHCFLLRLDPVASVAALDDEEATRAASLIPCDWFLGVTLAAGGAGLYAPDGKGFLNFRFCLIGTGVPTEFEPGAVPIAPLEPLVPDRPSVNFVPALPMEGLYVHTYTCMTAVVSRIHDTSEKPIATLSPEQHQLLRRYQARDEYDHGMFMHEKQVAEETARLAMRVSSPNEGGQAPAAAELGSSRSTSSVSGSDGGSEVSDIRYLLADEMQDRFRRVRVFVEVWLDPAFHAAPPSDPAKFEQTSTDVKAIWENWKERMLKETLAKRPQTRDWLQGVQDAAGGLDEAPPVDADIPYDDHAVLPEDAVDSRMEKDHIARQAASSMPGSETESEPAALLTPDDTVTRAVDPVQSPMDGTRPHTPLEDGERPPNGEEAVGALLPTQWPPGSEKEGEAQTNQPAATSSSSGKTGLLRVPKRSLALLRGSLSNIRSTLKRTKAQAIRVYNMALKTPPTSS